VQSSSITYDKRSTHEGFIRGEIYFVDASVLHLREFVDVETSVERLLYVYQYMDAHQQLRFRYDTQDIISSSISPPILTISMRAVNRGPCLRRPLM